MVGSKSWFEVVLLVRPAILQLCPLSQAIKEQDFAHDMTGFQEAHKHASQGIDKGKSSVVYLEGLWTSLLSKWYPDMVSEWFDVTTVVILSRAVAQSFQWVERINQHLTNLSRVKDTCGPCV